MLITDLKIENYKSLRTVDIKPSDLTVFVGANGSGKTNLADSIDFISEIYRHGLEVAVARKGGYENIAHHKKRRSKKEVSIDLVGEYTWQLASQLEVKLPSKLRTHHSFAFVAKGSSIRAAFNVVREHIDVEIYNNDTYSRLLTLDREAENFSFEVAKQDIMDKIFDAIPQNLRTRILGLENLEILLKGRKFPKTELLASSIGRWVYLLSDFMEGMSNIRVFQISPTISREFGVPIPNPELARSGANLPAVIDLLQKHNTDEWMHIMQVMRRVMPGLQEIEVGYTTSRTLGLFFHEINAGRAWNVGEVSDGTIQTLAILVAIFDPRSSAIVIEEPENSVHPWIIRNVLAACKKAASRKQILITTHSPIVVNYVSPEQVWVIWRAQGESKVTRLVDLDHSFIEMWENGKVATFDFLDSGAIPEAIPPAPYVEAETDKD